MLHHPRTEIAALRITHFAREAEMDAEEHSRDRIFLRGIRDTNVLGPTNGKGTDIELVNVKVFSSPKTETSTAVAAPPTQAWAEG